MFPDVLKMTWQEKDGSQWKAVEQNIVATTIQERKGTSSSLFISEKNGTEELKKYACYVEHEGDPKSERYQVVSAKGKGTISVASSSQCPAWLSFLLHEQLFV